MLGFEKAQAESESRLTAPYDIGGTCFDWDAYEKEREEMAEKQAEMLLDLIWN